MEWQNIEIDDRCTVKFLDLPYVPLTTFPQSLDEEEIFIGKKIGGIMHRGEWAWLARNSVLQIVSLRNGQTISSYEFSESRGYGSSHIKCVEEIYPMNPEVMMLAVILENFSGPGVSVSFVALFSVELNCVLKSIELNVHVTCARFMDASACRHSLLQNFIGCLAVGTEEGVIVLLDLNIRKIVSIHSEINEDSFTPCHIVEYNLPLAEILRNFRQCQKDGMHFGLQMEVIESPCSIHCILPIDLILGLAIGLEDGRLVLYDLAELQIFHIALPRPEVTMSALVKMDFLEPPDDPRPCLYIWSLHENGENLHAVLHSLMYEKRKIDEDESSSYFESFQTMSVRLQLPLEATKSVALACQAISTLSNHGEDDSNCLCVISWLSEYEGKNKLLIFDLNQWYKEEMPLMFEYGKQPNYLAGYVLDGECIGLHNLLNVNSIAHFNSMQRFEEHFYPNSLSFEGALLYTEGCRRYKCEGAQNRVINLLRSSNAAIFLDPNLCFNELIRTGLMPQFIELNMSATFSRSAKYEALLSTALEYNCISLLRDCAKSWIDGSFMCNFSSSTGLSLSTLTDWIWKRATCIKKRCNDLCRNLFEIGGFPLDNREQRELDYITRQLKLLSDLLKEILIYSKRQIPERVYSDLENKQNFLCMVAGYQNILLWLLNIGLLPEASPYNDKINAKHDLVPYPYKELKELYRKKRSHFAKISETFVSKKSGSCKLIYIDSFIEHACKGNVLQEYWSENDGDGLYPPNSLEAMLRVMLVPDLDCDSKYAILLYFFLDLNMAVDEILHKDVVENFIKFPSVFKLSASLIKSVQVFWNLDHDHYLPTVNEFISPFNKNHSYPQWQIELLIEVLLQQNASNLALRILESQSSLISPILKLKTLLANELISEAFHFVRSKNDDTLLENFFASCLNKGQFGVIRDLSLSEREGLLLQNILKRSKAQGAESLHFVYLLQKSKYIEAVSYMDELSSKSKSVKAPIKQMSHMNTPNLVLSAFNTTMTPVTQGLTDVYFRIKNKIKKKEVDNKSPVPLSCQLIKQNANNLLGGIYHSSALSAHFASYYWGEMEEQTKQANHLLNSNNAPFLRKPQIDTNYIDYFAKNNISYPQVYKASEKRTLAESVSLDNDDDEFVRKKIENELNPKKKRRLIGQEIVDDLSNFMKMNKTSNIFNISEFKFDPEQPNKSTEQNATTMELLTRPLVTKLPQRKKKPEEIVKTLPEIHGILKTNTSEPGHIQHEHAVEEEKNLRFRLPVTDVSNTHINIQELQCDDIEELAIITEVEHNKKMEKTQSPISKLRQITRSVSVESNKSSVASSNQSEENFYSPLSSQNNSKLDSSNLSRYSIMSGPQPRKPLARLSIERSEKSLTPEPEVKTKTIEMASIKESSGLGYVAKLNISSRRSIERLSSERLENSNIVDQVVSISSSNSNVYVTGLDILTKPLDCGASISNTECIQKSSNLGSIGLQATLEGSKINEFLPKVSSSKVGTTPAVEEKKPFSPAKLSECSTVLGPLTTFDCNNVGTNNISAMTSIPTDNEKPPLCFDDKPTEEQKRQMLETTLGMSTYDFTVLDEMPLLQTKSYFKTTTQESSTKLETSEENKIKEINYEQNNTNKKTEEIEYNEGSIEQAKEVVKHKKEHMITIQIDSSNNGCKEISNDDYIVLSSPSSSSLKDQEEDKYESSSCYNEERGGNEVDNDEDDEKYAIEGETDSDRPYDNDDGEELSIDETDNDSDTENEEIIQLLGDSSPDLRQQQKRYYEYSDSDDVKIIEDNHPVVEKETVEFSSFQEDIQDSKLTDELEQIIKTTKNDALSSFESENEERFSSKFDKLEKVTTFGNDNKKIDILISEAAGTSTTNIIPKNDKTLDVKLEEEITGTSINYCHDQEQQKDADRAKSKRQHIDNTSQFNKVEETFLKKIVESVANEIRLTESIESKIPVSENVNNEDDDETRLIPEVTAEEPITLRMENLIKYPDVKMHKQLESKIITEDEVPCKTEEKCKEVCGYSTLRKRETVHPIDMERMTTRGMSVPPETNLKSEELGIVTTRTRRNIRAKSLQPKHRIEENANISDDGISSRKLEKVKDLDSPARSSRTVRGLSLPPGSTVGKIFTRRRSALLDAINENSATLDSPSSRTRLKSRLNSLDSEFDSSITSVTEQSIQPKRNCINSIPSNVSDISLTPKRARRNSSSSQPEVGSILTPRTQRARSVLSVQEEDVESIPPSPKSTENKRISMKRKKSIAKEQRIEGYDYIEQISPKSDNSTMSVSSYPTSRRLTRTQLAIMEKSAALSQPLLEDSMVKGSTTISPLPNKRNAKSRSIRATNAQADSDDAESVSSKLSTTSSVTAPRRRSTRNSNKEKDEIEDDVASVASSVGSEKYQKYRRSKDKSSPNTTLTVIPENVSVETKKRGRPARH